MPNVVVNLENMPSGAVVTVLGLGSLVNDEENEISESALKSFLSARPQAANLLLDNKLFITTKALKGEIDQPVPEQSKPKPRRVNKPKDLTENSELDKKEEVNG